MTTANTNIETPKLLIRPLTADDSHGLRAILQDAVTMRHWARPFTDEDVRCWLERSVASHAAHGFGRCAVILKSSGAIIGDCGIMLTDVLGRQVYDLGWIIHADYWRQGYATEAAAALKADAFRRLGLPALHANMPADHEASRRVAERIGMEHVATFSNPRNRGILTLLYMARP